MLRLQRFDTRLRNPNNAHNRVASNEKPMGQWVDTSIYQTPENMEWVNYLTSHGNFKLVLEKDPS